MNPKVLDAPEPLAALPADPAVVKIVLGKLGKLDKPQPWPGLDALLADAGGLCARFPNLTHLYLWNLTGLQHLPELPEGLKVLDIRGCPDLTTLPRLPQRLERLIVEDCTKVGQLQAPALPDLVELSLKGSQQIPSQQVAQILESAPGLAVVDVSGVEAFRTVRQWPAALVDLRLNGCAKLAELPDWPAGLRRLELRNTTLEDDSLPPLPDLIDYLDLGGMRRLSKLPDGWQRVRTLFLYGSGVVIPPASEHGAQVDEDVAARTKEYFAECDRVGRGTVKRAKVLLLGNGGAGKTCLALRLVGGDPQRTKDKERPDHLGTTHGVQFHDWPVTVTVGNRTHQIAAHVWDFGGQEIYHDTHRLFVSKGSVFVIVWDPDHTWDQPVARVWDAYCDKPRPLSYWLDYVRQNAGLDAEVVVVVSRRFERDPKLERRLREEAGKHRMAGVPVFWCRSLENEGQLGDLGSAIHAMLGRVVLAQGTVVPVTWQIAQDLVQSWLKKMQEDEEFARSHRHLTQDEFGAELQQAIETSVASKQPEFAKLGQAMRDRKQPWQLTEARRAHLLHFLTHSGWVFWRPDLFEGRVILGQQWALNGIYTLLERGRPGWPRVYDELRQRQGRFGLDDLVGWGWEKLVPDPQERELLLSFLERIGLCLPLLSKEDSWFDRAVYLSLAHLPTMQELDAASMNPAVPIDLSQRRLRPETKWVERQDFHQGHWHAILRWLGGRFGRDGRYASDGFLVRNAEGQELRLDLEVDRRGYGGKIVVSVDGPQAAERCEQVAGAILELVSSEIERRRPAFAEDAPGEKSKAITVFISYAWDPEDAGNGATGAPPGYELPVEAICESLRQSGAKLDLIRDRYKLRANDSIVEHNLRIAKTDKVLVVHSDKYWQSQWCLHELVTFFHGLVERQQACSDVLSLVSHLQARVGGNPLRVAEAKQSLVEYWRNIGNVLPALEAVTTHTRLSAGAVDLLVNIVPKWAGTKDIEIAWPSDPAKQMAAVDQVVSRLLGRTP